MSSAVIVLTETSSPDTEVGKVRVEKGSTAKATCNLLSYSGTKLTSIKISAASASGGSESAEEKDSSGRSVSLSIPAVKEKWTVTCVATINGAAFSSSNYITVYGKECFSEVVSCLARPRPLLLPPPRGSGRVKL